MEKRNPIQKRDHTLKIRFPRWVFNIILTKMPTNGKKDKAGIRTRNFEATARRVTYYTTLSLFFLKDTLSRARTGDPWIKSPTLYQLSYEGVRCQFKLPSGSRTDNSEPSGDQPHVCCTPNGNLCGWVGCAGCSLWPGIGWCGTG